FHGTPIGAVCRSELRNRQILTASRVVSTARPGWFKAPTVTTEKNCKSEDGNENSKSEIRLSKRLIGTISVLKPCFRHAPEARRAAAAGGRFAILSTGALFAMPIVDHAVRTLAANRCCRSSTQGA